MPLTFCVYCVFDAELEGERPLNRQASDPAKPSQQGDGLFYSNRTPPTRAKVQRGSIPQSPPVRSPKTSADESAAGRTVQPPSSADSQLNKVNSDLEPKREEPKREEPRKIIPSDRVKGAVAPPMCLPHNFSGWCRGIQGQHNSCYMDASLFAMFFQSMVFDDQLHRPPPPHLTPAEKDQYESVQLLLREYIANPLRKWVWV